MSGNEEIIERLNLLTGIIGFGKVGCWVSAGESCLFVPEDNTGLPAMAEQMGRFFPGTEFAMEFSTEQGVRLTRAIEDWLVSSLETATRPFDLKWQLSPQDGSLLTPLLATGSLYRAAATLHDGRNETDFSDDESREALQENAEAIPIVDRGTPMEEVSTEGADGIPQDLIVDVLQIAFDRFDVTGLEISVGRNGSARTAGFSEVNIGNLSMARNFIPDALEASELGQKLQQIKGSDPEMGPGR